MIETDDIDNDFFTPVSSTSLANIFGKSQSNSVTENESLKYLPPKQTNTSNKSEEHKTTECVFASALLGYEWCNVNYVAKGKVGFALIKMVNTDSHNIILYDSNKRTLSCATITPNFIITFKENVYFSYIDNSQKYWCLYSSEKELTTIKKIFEGLGAIIKISTNGQKKLETSELEQVSTTEVESDTDDTLYKKTKMSILHRMANMGHSVLPSEPLAVEKSSSSSDTSENDYKTDRNKQIKNIERNSLEKTAFKTQALVEIKKNIDTPENPIHNVPLFTSVSGQFVPVSTSNVIAKTSSCCGNDLNYFITEQRINNSEVRININRVNDKIDQILCNMPHLKNKEDSTGEFQFEIMQKLLTEYETKIKYYEELLKSKSSEMPTIYNRENEQAQINELLDKIKELECNVKKKNSEISELDTKIKLSQSNHNNEIVIKDEYIESLIKKEQNLNLELCSKQQEILNLIDKYENKDENFEVQSDLKNKVKNIMNDTFQSISINFDNDKEYTGETIKNIIASIIKKVTIESLGSM
ncbi:hypothetical protein ACJJTC_010110 [Scirpophaga incertulas]